MSGERQVLGITKDDTIDVHRGRGHHFDLGHRPPEHFWAGGYSTTLDTSPALVTLARLLYDVVKFIALFALLSYVLGPAVSVVDLLAAPVTALVGTPPGLADWGWYLVLLLWAGTVFRVVLPALRLAASFASSPASLLELRPVPDVPTPIALVHLFAKRKLSLLLVAGVLAVVYGHDTATTAEVLLATLLSVFAIPAALLTNEIFAFPPGVWAAVGLAALCKALWYRSEEELVSVTYTATFDPTTPVELHPPDPEDVLDDAKRSDLRDIRGSLELPMDSAVAVDLVPESDYPPRLGLNDPNWGNREVYDHGVFVTPPGGPDIYRFNVVSRDLMQGYHFVIDPTSADETDRPTSPSLSTRLYRFGVNMTDNMPARFDVGPDGSTAKLTLHYITSGNRRRTR